MNITLSMSRSMKTMQRTTLLVVLLEALLTASALRAAGPIPLSTTTAYTRDFDNIGTNATANLLANFGVDKQAAVRTVGHFGTSSAFTEQVGAANLSSSATNGIYNFGAGTDSVGGADRAPGFLSDASGTLSGNLYARFRNSTGGTLSGVLLSYDVEKYRNGLNAAGFGIQLYYSLDDTIWISAGTDFLTSFPADSNNNGFATAPGTTAPVGNKVLIVTLTNGATLYLAWNYSVTSGSTTSNGQGLGIDNLSVLGLATVTPPTAATFPASAVTTNSATLSGTVSPNGSPTLAWFQWGNTTNYGSSSTATNVGNGSNALFLSVGLAGLTPNATYHYQLVASNTLGLAAGGDQSYQTVTQSPAVSNYALGGTASQSSTAYQGEASRAIDGNTDGNFADGSVAQTAGNENPAWWQVDLGTMKTIGGLSVWFRTDCCPDQADSFRLLVKDGAGNVFWQQQYSGQPPASVVYNFSPPVQGQIVRVESSGNPGGFLSLAEGQVFSSVQDATINITQDLPTNVVVEAGHPAIIGPVTVAVADVLRSLLTYQWLSNGVAIAGANDATYNTPALNLADSGKRYSCQISLPGVSVTSSEAVVSVTGDTTAPWLVSATFATMGTSDSVSVNSLQIALLFSEPVDSATALTSSNYSFTGGVITGASAGTNSRNVILNVYGIAPPQTAYSLVVRNVKDLAGNTMAAVTNFGFIPFYTINHALTGTASQSSIGSGAGPERAIDGNTDGNFTNNSVTLNAAPENPGWWEVDLGATKAVGQVHVWFRTDCCNGLSGVSGAARDDNFTLKVLDASRVAVWTTTYPGTPPSDVAFSFGSALQGRYVRFESQTPLTTSDGYFSLAEVQVIAPYTNFGLFEGIGSSGVCPTNLTVTAEEHHVALFGPIQAEVDGAPQTDVTYQWQRNGLDIAGATVAFYTTPVLRLTNNGDTYRCRLILPGASTNGPSFTLSVVPDQTPPQVLSVRFDEQGGSGPLKATVIFDGLMSSNGLANPANYHFTGGTIVSNTTPNADGRSVSFYFYPVAASNGQCSLTIGGVFDLKGNAIGAVPGFSGLIPFSSTNLALAGVASQSSVSLGGVAQRAIDGNTDGNFYDNSVTYNAPPEQGGWWEVNLGPQKAIGRIHLWFRTDCCANRQDNFTLKVLDSNRAVVWQQNYPGRPPTDVAFNIAPAIAGQYVRFEAPVPEIDNGAFSLAEVQVFAPYATNRTWPAIPVLAASLQATNLVLSWRGTGVLQSATSVIGPWAVLTNATSPLSVPIDTGAPLPARFFKVGVSTSFLNSFPGVFLSLDAPYPPESWPDQTVTVHFTLDNRSSDPAIGYVTAWVTPDGWGYILGSGLNNIFSDGVQAVNVAPHDKLIGTLSLSHWQLQLLAPYVGPSPDGFWPGPPIFQPSADSSFQRNPLQETPGEFTLLLQFMKQDPNGEIAFQEHNYTLYLEDSVPIDIYPPSDGSAYSDSLQLNLQLQAELSRKYYLDNNDGQGWTDWEWAQFGELVSGNGYRFSVPLWIGSDGSMYYGGEQPYLDSSGKVFCPECYQPVRVACVSLQWSVKGGWAPPYKSHSGTITGITLSGPGLGAGVDLPLGWFGFLDPAGIFDTYWVAPGQRFMFAPVPLPSIGELLINLAGPQPANEASAYTLRVTGNAGATYAIQSSPIRYYIPGPEPSGAPPPPPAPADSHDSVLRHPIGQWHRKFIYSGGQFCDAQLGRGG